MHEYGRGDSDHSSNNGREAGPRRNLFQAIAAEINKASRSDKIWAGGLFGVCGALLVASVFVPSPFRHDKAPTVGTTLIEPIGTNPLLRPSEAVPTTYPTVKFEKVRMAYTEAECGLKLNNFGKEVVDRGSYTFGNKPVVNRVRNGIRYEMNIKELDLYSNNGVEIGWQDGFYLTLSHGDQVNISNAYNGYNQERATGNTPNGSFTLVPGFAAEGTLGLLNYAIEDEGGNFYLGMSCNSEMTQKLIQRNDNVILPPKEQTL